jgi:DNA-binding phage protein
MTTKLKTIDYRPDYLTRLKNRRYALGLLRTAFEESCNDGNWSAFGLILSDVIDSQGSKSALAKKAKISRQTLYRLFDKKQNPKLSTLIPVLSELGLKLTLSVDLKRAA